MNSSVNETIKLDRQKATKAWWTGDPKSLVYSEEQVKNCIYKINQPVFIVKDKNGKLAATTSGNLHYSDKNLPDSAMELAAFTPESSMEDFGDKSFCKDYGIKYPYLGGSMAHGISSPEIAVALGEAGMMAFIGSAGDPPEKVEQTLRDLNSRPKKIPFGFNLIHSPSDSTLEDKLIDMYLAHGLDKVEASAFMNITAPIVRYRLTGIHEKDGKIVTPNKVIAKVSRVELAEKFFSPAPEKIVNKLLEQGAITAEQAQMAKRIPVAQDVTSEADSGGHTDNRPAISLHPSMFSLRNRMQEKYNYDMPLRVGFGGGVSTPASLLSSFDMGGAYVVVGTVNQACIESGTSDLARQLLANAGQADVAMAPAGDMFEMGVTVQVLKRGTMFAMRGKKLYEVYKKYNSIEEIPAAEKKQIEEQFFHDTMENIWEGTKKFFEVRDPKQVERAEKDPHHKMALVFRWYLGLSSRWATKGDESRKLDFQIWTGPAIGAFNEWAKDSIFEEPKNRKVVDVALNLIYGGTVLNRINQLKYQGVQLPLSFTNIKGMPLDQLKGFAQ